MTPQSHKVSITNCAGQFVLRTPKGLLIRINGSLGDAMAAAYNLTR